MSRYLINHKSIRTNSLTSLPNSLVPVTTTLTLESMPRNRGQKWSQPASTRRHAAIASRASVRPAASSQVAPIIELPQAWFQPAVRDPSEALDMIPANHFRPNYSQVVAAAGDPIPPEVDTRTEMSSSSSSASSIKHDASDGNSYTIAVEPLNDNQVHNQNPTVPRAPRLRQFSAAYLERVDQRSARQRDYEQQEVNYIRRGHFLAYTNEDAERLLPPDSWRHRRPRNTPVTPDVDATPDQPPQSMVARFWRRFTRAINL